MRLPDLYISKCASSFGKYGACTIVARVANLPHSSTILLLMLCISTKQTTGSP